MKKLLSHLVLLKILQKTISQDTSVVHKKIGKMTKTTNLLIHKKRSWMSSFQIV